MMHIGKSGLNLAGGRKNETSQQEDPDRQIFPANMDGISQHGKLLL
jgi:hypothetical protein